MGLYDPCEKEQTDTTGNLSNQLKEDITTSAQVWLKERQWVFIVATDD